VSLFKRGKSADDESTTDTGVAEDVDATDPAVTPPVGERTAAARAAAHLRDNGPFDVSEVETTDGLVDLGSLLVPAVEGMELRLELSEEDGEVVVGVTVLMGESAVQVQAFAAPRGEGIWDEVRAEIASGITQQGGTADELDGSFGRELLARVPGQGPDGRAGFQPARFVGVDGPRWFLRAVFTGSAVDEAKAADMTALVRSLVVVRGGEAMAPRELLPLRIPRGPESEDDPPAEYADDLDPFERGPEITEIR
jgi:hypothetical protein